MERYSGASWKKLDIATARHHGASCAEEVIQTVCAGCSKGNLDFSSDDFCPIQVDYGWDGEHPAIKYNTDDFLVVCEGSDEEVIY